VQEKSGAGKGRDRGAVIGDGLARLSRWSIGLVAVAAAAVVLGWIISTIWVVLLPVALAMIVTTVLGPPAAWLRRHGWPPAVAAVTIMLLALGALAGVGYGLAPSVAGQAGEIASGASQGLQRIQDWITDGPLALSDSQLDAAIAAVQDRLQSSAAAIGEGVFSTIGAATSVIVNLILVLMLTFFFVKDGHRFIPWASSLGGGRSGRHTTAVLSRCWETLAGFIRTQSLVSLIDAVIIGAGLMVLGVPLAIPLAVVTFFGGFIPIIGAFVTGALAVLVTLVTGGLTDALVILLIVLAVQQLEGNVLSPWLQGKTMKLHAAVVLLSVAAGGSLFGIVGAFLAVPVVATVTESLRYVNEQINAAVTAPGSQDQPATAVPGRESADTVDVEAPG